jgi:hypothetical protein
MTSKKNSNSKEKLNKKEEKSQLVLEEKKKKKSFGIGRLVILLFESIKTQKQQISCLLYSMVQHHLDKNPEE